MVAVQPPSTPIVEGAAGDRVARRAHERYKKMYIVQGEQAHSEHLVRDEEVPQVGATESGACGAVAHVVERSRVRSELGALDVHPSVSREYSSIPAHARWGDAIEQVHPALHAFDEIFRKAHAHEIAWTVERQCVVNHLEHAVHVRLGLADGKAADAESAPIVDARDCRR